MFEEKTREFEKLFHCFYKKSQIPTLVTEKHIATMKSFFKELFEYNFHSNQQLAELFLQHSNEASEKSLKLFSHILNAHHIWNNRIEEKQKTFNVWDIHTVQAFKQIDKNNHESSLRILDTFDLNQNIFYSNSKGDKFNNNIKDMLFHVINHSTYHRAQIATEFKQSGITPLATDYIFYKRS